MKEKDKAALFQIGLMKATISDGARSFTPTHFVFAVCLRLGRLW